MMNTYEVFTAADVAITAARQHGVQFKVKDRGLVLEARKVPPAPIMEALNAQKAHIMASLKPMSSKPAAEDWLVFFRKRVIAEEIFNGLSVEQARVQAFEWCITVWLNEHPELTANDKCAWCQGQEKSSHVVVPFGINPSGLTWLHSECWWKWRDARRSKAFNALITCGIQHPQSSIHQLERK
jgi:hypothetical protein